MQRPITTAPADRGARAATGSRGGRTATISGMTRERAVRKAALLVALPALLGLLVVPASAQTAAAEACPSGRVPATAFTDTVRSTHRASIDCAAWWAITSGRTATTFGPDDAITRGQASAMIVRLLRQAGVAPEAVPSAGFADTTGHLFEDDIDELASLGIVTGTSPTTFAPDDAIARDQMASIIVRMFELGIGTPLPTATATFQDVASDSVHAAAIGRLAGAGITAGTSATRFEPRRTVVRGQMATFLMRATSRLVGQGAVTLPLTGPAADDPYHSRTRAAWVHLFDDTLKDRAGIDALVEELSRADANTVIAQVARRHDAYYDSDVLPRTPDPALAADFDVLAELLVAAHARDIEVHAWISVAPTTHQVYDDLPAPTGWVAATHGQDAPEADRWVSRRDDEVWSQYLDPGVPAVQDHVAAIVGELAERYLVDGIHLDYVRYESPRHGYHPIALARFQEETGRTDIPDASDSDWSHWRRQQTTEIMQRAGAAIEASGRDVALSAPVITWGAGPVTLDRAGFRGSMPYWRTLQDWDAWVRNGLVDAVFPMNYFRQHDAEQRAWWNAWLAYERYLAGEVTADIVAGPAGYLNRPANAAGQIRSAMQATDGASIYSYQQPTEDGSRVIWRELADTRWGYAPRR